MVEQPIRNRQVGGSSPFIGSTFPHESPMARKPKSEKKVETADKDSLGGLFAALAASIEKTSHYISDKDIKYPLEISKVNTYGRLGFNDGHGIDHGSLVAVRPVNSEKTYLGVYLGEIPIRVSHAFDPKTKELNFYIGSNPAICIPDLGCRVVMGAGSWWRELKSKDQLKDITDADIQNVWYVKALTQIKDFESEKMV